MSKELEALKVWYAVKKYMNLYHHMTVKENIEVKTVEGMPIDIIEKSLKALEIIKETPIFAWYITIYKNAYEMVSDAKGFRTNNSVEELQEMFDLLKKVLL